MVRRFPITMSEQDERATPSDAFCLGVNGQLRARGVFRSDISSRCGSHFCLTYQPFLKTGLPSESPIWEQIHRNFVMSHEKLLKANVVYFILSLLKSAINSWSFCKPFNLNALTHVDYTFSRKLFETLFMAVCFVASEMIYFWEKPFTTI